MALKASYQLGTTPGGGQDARPAFQKVENDVGDLFSGLAPVRKVVLSTALSENDHTVFVAGGNAVTITLPKPSLTASTVGGTLGTRFEVVNTQVSNAATVAAAGGVLINGAASYSLAAGATAVFRTDGSNWFA